MLTSFFLTACHSTEEINLDGAQSKLGKSPTDVVKFYANNN
ncbi:MAG: hypothetical protein ACI3ZZ_02965 [Candidatus Aphodosoma sp.]